MPYPEHVKDEVIDLYMSGFNKHAISKKLNLVRNALNIFANLMVGQNIEPERLIRIHTTKTYNYDKRGNKTLTKETVTETKSNEYNMDPIKFYELKLKPAIYVAKAFGEASNLKLENESDQIAVGLKMMEACTRELKDGD